MHVPVVLNLFTNRLWPIQYQILVAHSIPHKLHPYQATLPPLFHMTIPSTDPYRPRIPFSLYFPCSIPLPIPTSLPIILLSRSDNPKCPPGSGCPLLLPARYLQSCYNHRSCIPFAKNLRDRITFILKKNL